MEAATGRVNRMNATKREFDRFLLWLNDFDAPADVRRLANGISSHFLEIAATKTAQGARARAIVRALLPKFADLDDVLNVTAEAARAADVPWTRLVHLQVGPFRGFTTRESLDFGKRVVLIYGPNGTGKSSLCEAIEYALTGTLTEASAKRIPDDEYCMNAHVDAFAVPRLIASDAQGAQYVVEPNADALRFCIIEKNRIDEFSRISARTPREQARSIAALFGVDQFDDFVANFNESLEGHLNLSGPRAFALELKRRAIEVDSRLLAAAPEKRQEFDVADAHVAAEFAADFTFERLCNWIGNIDRPARLTELARLLETPAAQPVALTWEVIQARRQSVDKAIARIDALSEQLRARRREVSFKHLYDAVLALRTDSPKQCPACETPLAGTARDPFVKASEGLAELAELARIEEERNLAQVEYANVSRLLRATLETIVGFATREGSLSEEVISCARAIAEDPEESVWRALPEQSFGGKPFWTLLEDVMVLVEAHDQEVRRDAEVRASLREERLRLQTFERRVVEQIAARKAFETSVREAAQRVSTFETENKALFDAVEAEKAVIARNHRFNGAYNEFLTRLRQYRDSLPATLLAGLNANTRDLYNAFNRDDDESDKLAELRLPTAPDQPMLIAFRHDPHKSLDALHVLSEGHIRCLGLSILVAKFIQQRCPVMIFDDAVNAIDDDHRNGICKTIFTEDWMKDRQIILTCHGEEFIKSIQRDLGAEAVRHDALLYVFRPRASDRSLNIDTQPRTRNYVLLARQSFDSLEIREALSQARRALEGIVDRLWRWLSSRGRGEVKLIFKQHGSHAELRNVTEALLKSVSAADFAHERKESLREGLTALLGIQAGSLEWSYLNSGTHEADRGEFDRVVVGMIVEAIERLDGTLTSRQ